MKGFLNEKTTDQLFRFWFECDDYGYGGWRKPRGLEPVELLELLEVYIRSLQNQFAFLGHAVIRRSGQGYHITFPQSKVTWPQYKRLLQMIPHDVGWAWWSNVYGRSTLRIGAKPVVQVLGDEFSMQVGSSIDLNKPQPIRVIMIDGEVLCRREIERRFGDV